MDGPLNLARYRGFYELNHTGDLKNGTTVVTLPDPWRYMVSAGTSWPGVSKL